jgi:hypothetical protein
MSEEKKNGCLKFGLIGCGVVLIIGIIVVVVGGLYVKNNAKGLLAGIVEVGAKAMITELPISEEEKTKSMEQIGRITEKIKSGEINAEQGQAIIAGLQEDFLMPVTIMVQFDNVYIPKSSLTAPEKEAAKLTVNRFMQGISGGKIDASEMQSVFDVISLNKVSTQPQPGQQQPNVKAQLSKDELDKCLKAMKTAADKAGVGAEKQDIKVSDMLKKIIDKGLGTPQE